jgi:hypothetical protein
MDEQGVTAPPSEAPGAGGPSELGTARLIFRFAVGGSALLAEWVGTALRSIDRLPPVDGEEPVAIPTGARTVVVGALSSALRGWPRGAPIGVSGRAGRLARRGLRVLAILPGADLARRRLTSVRAAATAPLRRWAEEGAREELAGRRLAGLAAPRFFEAAVAHVADSPELRLVITQQSEGLAASSVAELRDRSQAADGAVERAVRRVLRRKH